MSIKNQIYKFFDEIIAELLFQIGADFKTDINDNDVVKKNELIKSIILELLKKKLTENIFDEIPKELTFFVSQIISNTEYDDPVTTYNKYKDLIHKFLYEYLGINKEHIKRLTPKEITDLFYSVGTLLKSRASLFQIQELVKIFGLEGIVSIGELQISYDFDKDKPYFSINWITHPVDDIYKLKYDYVYSKVPELLLTEEDIKENKNDLLFPIKTNILYIHTKTNVFCGLISFLKAALFGTKFKDRVITEYGIYVEDLPILIHWLIFKLYGAEYISKDYPPIIRYYISLFELNSLFVEDYNAFKQLIDLLYPSQSNVKNSNHFYEIKYHKLKQLLDNFVFNSNEKIQQTTIKVSDFEEYLKNKYPKLINKLNSDIFNNSALTENEKREQVKSFIVYLFLELLNLYYQISDTTERAIFFDTVFSFISAIAPNNNSFNILEKYISDRIDVILTQTPYYIIPFMDYIIGAEIIKDTLNSIPMYSKIKNVKIKKSIPDFMFFRVKFGTQISNKIKNRFLVFDIAKSKFFGKLTSKISILDNSFIIIKNKNISHIFFRETEKSKIATVYKNRFLINNFMNLKILEQKIDKYAIFDKPYVIISRKNESNIFYQKKFFTTAKSKINDKMRISDKVNYYVD